MNNIKTKEEKTYIKTDIMRYNTNKISFWLTILAIVCDVVMFLIIYKETSCTSGVLLGVDLLVNVLFMLAGFLLAEQNKAYNKKGGFFSIGLGIVEILRIFVVPFYYYQQNVAYMAAYNEAIANGTEFSYSGTAGLSGALFAWCCALMISSGLCLIIAGAITISKEKRLSKHLSEISKGGK